MMRPQTGARTAPDRPIDQQTVIGKNSCFPYGIEAAPLRPTHASRLLQGLRSATPIVPRGPNPNPQGNQMILRFFKPGLGAALLAARVLFALAATPAALAHDAHHPAETAQSPEESAFLAENDAAMNKMMADMAAKPSGDIDRDFVAMMMPHHQGAIDMAVIELRYGKNEQLRRIAQEIIVEQQQEIDAMKLAIGEPVTASAPAPTQPAPAAQATHDHMNMSHEMKK
jgi:hypothetical protein